MKLVAGFMTTFVLMSLMSAAGCVAHRQVIIDTVACFPDGGSIVIACEKEAKAKGGHLVAAHVRADGTMKELTITPAPRVKEQPMPDLLEATPRMTSDNQRVWLIQEGRVIASFDLENGQAFLDPLAQPPWATME